MHGSPSCGGGDGSLPPAGSTVCHGRVLSCHGPVTGSVGPYKANVPVDFTADIMCRKRFNTLVYSSSFKTSGLSLCLDGGVGGGVEDEVIPDIQRLHSRQIRQAV